MAGWHDTIDVMLDLTRWWHSSTGVYFGDSFTSTVNTDPAYTGGPLTKRSGWLAETALTHLEHSEPFFVSPDVFEMVDAAAKSFEPEEFRATDLITTSGFVLLPRSFRVRDSEDKAMTTRAFSWGPCEGSATRPGASAPATGTFLMCYSDVHDETSDWHDEIEGIHERFDTPNLTLWHFTPWWFNRPGPDIEGRMLRDDGTYSENNYRIRDLWTWLQTFFRLSMQQIITTQYATPPRPYARRAKRAGRDPGVLVMSLRRRSQKVYGEGQGEPIERDFQWLVRGHWRNQWYESLGMHRQIWIAPYVKGPEGKPFKRPDLRVWTFNR